MKSTTLILLTILACTACKKDRPCSSSPYSPDYFEFGYSGGLAGIQKKFVIYHGNLYPTDTNHAPLPASKYASSLPVINNLPAYLLQHPNQKFSCQGCADEMVINIISHKDGITTTWDVDSYTESLPVEIRAYEQQVYNIIDTL